ncbi:hypothetical protein OESDEN_24416 [Oesophagostomum dentatum]|uniref:Uncharacterized protein n=1 Tax=Oesophagostomum dentatum TaxID=61180 RepID=A0A0B1RY59_OESDE|nr:hypothetical protein OESDEN_24416 [Oesophagostomum dentatum]
MRGLSNSPINVGSAGSSGSTEESNEAISSSGSESPQEGSSPVPNVAVVSSVPTTPKHVLSHTSVDHKIRSTLSTPASYLGPSPRSSSYVMKLVEKGCNNHSEDVLSPEIRRKAEANLSRTSSIQSLRGSIGNLAGWRGSISNLSEEQLRPNLSRFRSSVSLNL